MSDSQKPFSLSEEEAKVLFEPVVLKVIEVLTGQKKARLNIVPYQYLLVGENGPFDAVGYTVELEVLDAPI